MKENQHFNSKISLILYFLYGAKRYFLLSACFAALVSLLDMVSPKVISFTVDSVIGDAPPAIPGFALELVEAAGGVGNLKAHLLLIAAAAAFIGAMAALSRYCFRAFNARGAERFVERMRNRLLGHIMELPYTWLGENSTGDIIQRCTSDVQTIKRFVSEQMTSLVRTMILIVMAVVFMAGISWKIMLAAVVFIPIVVGYSLFFHTKIGKAFEKADIEEGMLSTIAQENLTGVRVVRAFGREVYEAQVRNHSDYIKSAAPEDGVEKVMMPGEYEHENYERLTKEGIELPPDTWNGLIAIAKSLGCEWSKDLEAGETNAGFVRY